MHGQTQLEALDQPTSIYIRVRPTVRRGLLAVDVWPNPDLSVTEADEQGLLTGTWVYPQDLADHLCQIGAVIAGIQFAERSRRS